MSETPSQNSRLRFRFPYQIRIESRMKDAPKWYSFALTIGSVVVALLLGAVIIASAGADPVRVYQHIAKSSFGSLGVFSDTMVKAIPLMLVGLACSLAFRMKLWNIGAEGQFFVGAWGASLIVLLPVLPEDAPTWLFILFTAGAGMIMGALWGFVPGILKAKFGVNEIISTLMLNYIAVEWNNYFIYAVWSDRGFQMSPRFQVTHGCRADRFCEQFPILPATTHAGLIFGPYCCGRCLGILAKAKWDMRSFDWRYTHKPSCCSICRISIKRNIVW